MIRQIRLLAVTAVMAAVVSTGAMSATTRYEAEAVGNTLVGCTARTGETPVWYSGTGFVGALGDSATDVLKFNDVVASVTGDYSLLLAYKTWGTRQVDLVVNGGPKVRVDCLEKTNNLGTMTQTVTLNAGNNIIELWGTGSWAPDIDYIDISGGPAVPEPSSLMALGSMLAPLGFLLRRKQA